MIRSWQGVQCLTDRLRLRLPTAHPSFL